MTVIDAHNWRAFARCGREVRAGRADPRWWDHQPDVCDGDPEETREQREARHNRAKAICDLCPLAARSFCRADVKAGVDEGVRVGVLLTPLTIGQSGSRKAKSA